MARQIHNSDRQWREPLPGGRKCIALALNRPATKVTSFLIVVTLCLLFGWSLAHGASLDYFGPPPAGDPSAYRDPIISDNVNLGPEANEGSLLLQGG
ncbi:MAG: hypothetical protein ACM319_04150, partial [Deltaproteobacteria bacterium]